MQLVMIELGLGMGKGRRRVNRKVKHSYFKQIRSGAIKRKVVPFPVPAPVLETVIKFVASVFRCCCC